MFDSLSDQIKADEAGNTTERVIRWAVVPSFPSCCLAAYTSGFGCSNRDGPRNGYSEGEIRFMTDFTLRAYSASGL